MGEVGDNGPQFHREIGAYAHERGLEALLAVGMLTRESVAAFGTAGRHFDDIDALVADLRLRLEPQVTALVKGSRFMRMERVVRALTEMPAQPAAAEPH